MLKIPFKKKKKMFKKWNKMKPSLFKKHGFQFKSTTPSKKSSTWKIITAFGLMTVIGPTILYYIQDRNRKYTGEKKGKITNLKDERYISYCDYGSPDGKVIFYLHEGGSSRLEISSFMYETLGPNLQSLGVRIICIDR